MSEIWVGAGVVVLLALMVGGFVLSQFFQVYREERRWRERRSVRARIDLDGEGSGAVIRSALRVLAVIAIHLGLTFGAALGLGLLAPAWLPWLVPLGLVVWCLTLGPVVGSDLTASGKVVLEDDALRVSVGREQVWKVRLDETEIELASSGGGATARQWIVVRHPAGDAAFSAPHSAPRGPAWSEGGLREFALASEGHVLVEALAKRVESA